MTHGRRPGVIPGGCPVTGKSQFTCYRRAAAAVTRVKDAIRAYRCTGCGWYHITKLTEDEYALLTAERIAELEGCTPSRFGGIIGITDEEEHHEEAEAQHPGAERREPGEGAGGPGEAPLARGGSTRLTPSPAEVARRLSSRIA